MVLIYVHTSQNTIIRMMVTLIAYFALVWKHSQMQWQTVAWLPIFTFADRQCKLFILDMYHSVYLIDRPQCFWTAVFWGNLFLQQAIFAESLNSVWKARNQRRSKHDLQNRFICSVKIVVGKQMVSDTAHPDTRYNYCKNTNIKWMRTSGEYGQIILLS